MRCDKDAALVYAYLDAAARDYPRPATYRRPKAQVKERTPLLAG